MSKSKTMSSQEEFARADIAAMKDILDDLPEFAVIERFSMSSQLTERLDDLQRILDGKVELSKSIHVALNLDLFDRISEEAEGSGLTIPQYVVKVLQESSNPRDEEISDEWD